MKKGNRKQNSRFIFMNLGVLTERTRLWTQTAKMTFLFGAAGRTLGDTVRSSVTQEELEIELLLLNNLFQMPHRHPHVETFRACSIWELAPGNSQHTLEETHFLAGLGMSQGPTRLGGEMTGIREVWVSLLLPHNPTTDKQRWMDGWIDGITPAVRFSMFWP